MCQHKDLFEIIYLCPGTSQREGVLGGRRWRGRRQNVTPGHVRAGARIPRRGQRAL